MRNSDHRGLIDNADRVPGKHRVAQLRAVDSGRDSGLELPCEPGERAVAAKADAMVLRTIVLESQAKPSGLTIGRPPGRFQLGRSNTDLDRTLRNRAVQRGSGA